MSPWESILDDLAQAANDRWEDKENKRLGKEKPKKFRLERDGNFSKVRFSFQFSRANMGIPRRDYRSADGWGYTAFDAYVDYAALERFLNELEAERKALMQDHGK